MWNEEELLQLADEMAAIVQQHILPKRRADAARDAERVRRFIRERRAVILADLDPETAGLALAAGRCRYLLAGKRHI